MNPAQQVLADHRQASRDAVRLIYPTAPQAGQGQIEFQFTLSDDLEVTVHCDYQRAERMTMTDPGCDEEATVTDVYLYDQEISQRCTKEEIAAMEIKALEVAQELRDEAEIDRYETSLEY